MKLTINGEIKLLQGESKTLDLVIKELDYNPQTIVIEFNGTIINRDMWSGQKVQNGDNLEIVTIVGGGL